MIVLREGRTGETTTLRERRLQHTRAGAALGARGGLRGWSGPGMLLQNCLIVGLSGEDCGFKGKTCFKYNS